MSTEARREYFWAAQAWYRLTPAGWVLDAEQGPAPKVEIEWPKRTQGLYPKRKR
jgi:hypothetical protein